MAKGIKTGGRTKDTPNKITQEVRESYHILLSNNLDKMQSWIDEVGEENPAKALDIMIKMSEFVIPKMSRVEVKEDEENKKMNVPISLWAEHPELASQISGLPKITFVD